MLIDDAARRATNGAWSYDRDGALAARGKTDATLLAELMLHPFLHQSPPKTTGREVFGAPFGEEVWARGKARGLRDEDIVATVTTFTAHSIVQAYRDFLPQMPDEVIVSGGGAQNPTLIAMLRELVAPARVIASDEIGLPSEAKEAIAFAILAYETAHNRPGNLAAATGARRAVVLGDMTPSNQLSVISGQRSVAGDVSNLTEATNPATADIDTLTTLEMVRRINAEDARVAQAVATELPHIVTAIDAVVERMRAGGRLIYVGAGTSGRLGVLDASEMPPTFSVSPDLVIGVIAGGDAAIRHAVEGAEDDVEQGKRDIARLNVGESDSVVGLSASGRTPYVIGALMEAKARGALTISLACNRPAPMQEIATINIAPLVGPEVIAGSTRLKAGAAEKMVLNMLSTGVMVRLGKTYGNLMVDVQATNAKLRERARRIVQAAGNVSANEADALLAQCDGEVKTAIVVARACITPDEARRRLAKASGSVRGALHET